MASKPSITEVKKVVFKLSFWQLLIGLLVALIFYLANNLLAGIAGFYGSSIGFAGSIVFAFVLFGFGPIAPEDIMKRMFRAEAFKIMTISIMFYCAFGILGLPLLPVLVGFMASLIIFFVALLTVFK